MVITSHPLSPGTHSISVIPPVVHTLYLPSRCSTTAESIQPANLTSTGYTMSASSGTTLISPSTTGAPVARAPSHPVQRRQSSHSAHSAHAHHPKRRASHHHAHHGHGGHSAGGRRTSEGEQGRRAMAAGLAMQMLDSAGPKQRRRSRSREVSRQPWSFPMASAYDQRPLTKASRSDTHLPTLSRTTSIKSEASEASAQSSDPSASRPKNKNRSKSGESVLILSEDGKESVEVDSEEEGWESGEEEEKETKPKAKSGRSKQDASATSAAMRRTVSDTQAEVPPKAGDVKAVVDTSLDLRPVVSGESAHSDHHTHLTRRTTGFAGAIHTPAPDPAMEAQALKNVSTPHYNDPTHVMPAHQIRHQQSARSIHMTPNASSTDVGGLSAIDGEKTPKPGSVVRTGSGQGHKRQHSQPAAPKDSSVVEHPQKTRSTEGSGLPPQQGAEVSPSFPFPKMQSPEQAVTSPPAIDSVVSPSVPPSSQPLQHTTPPSSTESVPQKQRSSAPPAPNQKLPEPRQRLASGAEPRLRHRYSNSSLRSIQSLRAPPHPLNSPTGGYRSGLPTVATSRPGSAFNSPQKGERKGPNMHHPPIAPPVVYREVATGEGWPSPEEAGSNDTSTLARPPANGSSRANDRKSSFSSQRSLQGLMTMSKSRTTPGTAGGGIQARPPVPSKRRTAIEVASAAAKMPTTNDPAEYHHSLGYPASSAESAHLISRFLPQRKNRHFDWEITSENSEQHSGIGLSRGEYRDAHESLVRMMKEMTVSPIVAPTRRPVNRALSYQTLLGPVAPGGPVVGGGLEEGGQQVGTTRGRNGMLAVAKGGWKGRTPFEMSFERVAAQRPQRAGVMM